MVTTYKNLVIKPPWHDNPWVRAILVLIAGICLYAFWGYIFHDHIARPECMQTWEMNRTLTRADLASIIIAANRLTPAAVAGIEYKIAWGFAGEIEAAREAFRCNKKVES